MNGIIRPAGSSQFEAESAARKRWWAVLHSYRYFIGLVILPTLLVAGYYYLIAADQYEARADFIVRKAGSAGRSGGGGVGQILGFSIGSADSQSEALILEEYLMSHDAVARLRKEDNLVERFRREGVDLLSRLWDADPAPEDLLEYYRKHVLVELDTDNGISSLSVRAFTPQDSQAIARKLLEMGEQRVNAINERAMRDELAAATRTLATAERDMLEVQSLITAFRRTNEDIDPTGTAKAQIGLVSELTANLANARAKLNSVAGLISKNSPQYRTLEMQVRALEEQVAEQNARLSSVSNRNTIAADLGGYEALLVRQEFVGKRYTAAAAAYEQAQAEARKQQLYLVRVVEPNLPVKSQYPERGRIVLTVFFLLAISYAIGWLMVAGVKEHSLSS